MKKYTFQRAIIEARRSPAEGLVSSWSAGQNPRYGALSLREYRFSYPSTAPVPTLTQSGGLGPLLEHLEYKEYRSARRRERLERILDFMVRATVWAWTALTAPPRPVEAAIPVVAVNRP